MDPEKLDSLAASFTLSLKAGGKAARTRHLYAETVRFYTAWLTEQGVAADLSGLTKTNVIDWLSDLRDRGLADSTVSYRFRALHRFAGWLVAEKIVEADPLAGITVDRPEPTPVPVLSDTELTELIRACQGNGFRERRDEALIRLLIDTGLRVSELVGIDTADLDLDAETVTVTGKGNRQRPLYFGSRTALALDRYLRARRGHRHAGQAALFLGERGRFTTDGVRERMKTRARLAGLDPMKVHPHAFRHSWAHDWRLHGGDSEDLKRLAGWRSDAMLSRYGASAADQRAREAAKRLRRGDRV
ncbi:MAG TPA: tyrosine-type recombinase/integrase [Mycobacterium sp.]|nr:tyrosine-type recombinase/integrase [Mycobacterium sp.]